MYQVCGVTPEAPAADPDAAAETLGHAEIDAFYASFQPSGDALDVVVFAAPQLSILEIQALARLLDGKRLNPSTALLVATSPEIRHGAERMGYTQAIERAGGVVLEGVCFYQMHARVLAEANGWRTLMTNSAKLVNIIAGYGYEPLLAPMERCVEAALAGRFIR
jgi:predicted aconitase